METLAAAAGGSGARVVNLEALALKAVIEIDLAPLQILLAGRIDDKLDAIVLKVAIIRLGVIKAHTVLKAGTAARLHKHTQQLPLGGVLGGHGKKLLCSTVAQFDHKRHFLAFRAKSQIRAGDNRHKKRLTRSRPFIKVKQDSC